MEAADAAVSTDARAARSGAGREAELLARLEVRAGWNRTRFRKAVGDLLGPAGVGAGVSPCLLRQAERAGRERRLA